MKTHRDYNNRQRAFWLLAGMLAALLSVSCSKDAPAVVPGGEPQPAGRPIELRGMFGQDHTGTAPEIKAPVDGGALTTPELTLWFARADETASGNYAAYGSSQLSAVRPAAGGDTPTELSFNAPEPCYLLGNLKTKLTGWYPGGGAAGSAKGYWSGTNVTWKIDGSQDIMTAPAQEGSGTILMPTLVFSHRTAQLRFYLYAETEAIASLWGKITGLQILKQANACTYTPSTDGTTGAVAFTGSTAGFEALSAPVIPAVTTDKAAAARAGDAVMIAPQTSGYTLELEVESEKLGTVSVTLPARVYEEAGAYDIYLRLQAVTISPAVDISDWSATVEKDVEL